MRAPNSPRKISQREFLYAMLIVMAAGRCVSYVDVAPDRPGGVNAPVRCASAEDQRGYLKRLRSSERPDERLDYEYLDAVLGPEDVVLDRFRVENPLPDERGPFAVLFDLFRFEPDYAPAYRVYLSMYGDDPLCGTEAPPGYELLQE